MQKWNLKHLSVYASLVTVIFLYSFISPVIPLGGKIIQAYQKILFAVPILFLMAAFLAYRISETGIVLTALAFLVLTPSHPLTNFLQGFAPPEEGVQGLGGLLSSPLLMRFHTILPLILPFTLSLIFILPAKAGRTSLTMLKIGLMFLPLTFFLYPGPLEAFLFSEVYYGRIWLPWRSLAASLIPLAAPWLYRNRRSGTFSLALTFALFLTILPRMLFTERYLTETCYLFAGIILLHSLYRVYWDNSYIDELTGLFNRRALDERLHRLRRGYSLAMVDVDHFKNFNDSYGHDEGDNVLRLVAKILYLHFGKSAYRYGGEEFCIVFPKTGASPAAEEMDAARAAVEEHQFSIRQSVKNRKKSARKKPARGVKKVRLTVSAGVASAGQSREDATAVLRNADKALYKAKEAGRNRVEIGKDKGRTL